MNETEKLLNDKGVRFFPKGKDLLVQCFNPEHDDEHPSMRIDRESGAFHCFGCGHKGNVYTRFNRYRNIFSSRVTGLKDKMAVLRRASWAGFSIPIDASELKKEFRGIPLHILHKYNAFTSQEMGMEDRVVFPITNHAGEIQGFQGRYARTKVTPKYLMYPPGVSLPWFPAANTIEMLGSSIVLTEGLLDALYLHGKGVTNAVTIFGTKSVTFDRVLELLTPYMLSGCEKVYLLMDGDSAGRNAALAIEKMIKHQTELLVEIIPLEDDEDPATMSNKDINKLKTYLTNN